MFSIFLDIHINTCDRLVAQLYQGWWKWRSPHQLGNSIRINLSWLLPHGIEQSAVILQAQKFVWCCHVVSNRLLAIVEKSVWGPNLAGEQIVKRETLHRSFESQPFILPALSEKNINGVFLAQRNSQDIAGSKQKQWFQKRLQQSKYNEAGSHVLKLTISVSDTGPKLVTQMSVFT